MAAEQERFDLLQPDQPGVYNILNRVGIEHFKSVATKEVELCSASPPGRIRRRQGGGDDCEQNCRGSPKQT
jgi:hypothetical protein